ncbi:MAG: TonB-dependent hemoglobin/transferrin/lactoferrin family receptor [Alphaproteobacteria bacterium]|nr:TonB-dependent hemoglobin/transferrin/lactoferrin family receptor [Alphaproteobacteria bacterium]MCW5740311.1 TonB-dependent hemoglobin/transferrin/lactoferrin family receptor [Alphaproteobacteria bacterium]
MMVVAAGIVQSTSARAQTASPAGADPAVLLPPITATATRGEKSLIDTPANVSTIVREEMDRRMLVTIEDAVRNQPGIQVNRQTSGTDPFKSLGGFTIRGVGGNRVLTMVDGSRTIERITDQTRDFVDLSNMKKVEIVRGPASVLWGSDALGGVVAFTTKDPADYIAPGRNWGVQVDSNFNSVNTGFTNTVTGAIRVDHVEAMLSYTRRDAEQYRLSKARAVGGVWPCTRAPESLPCNELDPAWISSNSLLGKLVWNANNGHRVKLTGEYFDRETMVDQLWDNGRPVNANGTFGTTTTLDYMRWQTLRRYRLALEHEWKADLSYLDALRWQVGFHPQTLNRTGHRIQQLANGQRTFRDDFLGYQEYFYELDLQLKSSIQLASWMKHSFTYGFAGSLAQTDYSRRDILTNLTTGATTTTVAGGFNFANASTWRADAYVQDEIALFGDRLLITPGLRFSTYRILPRPGPGYRPVVGAEPRNIYADDLSLKLGIVYKLDKTFSLYGQYAEGFKMPTAEQLYTSLPGTGFNLVPNPTLRPERVRSYEIGVRGQLENAFFSINGFHADYTDFIQNFVSIPGTTDITYQNLSSLKLWGIEATGAWRVTPNWELSAAVSYQYGNQQTDATSPVVPYNGAEPWKFVGGIRWTKPEWGLDVDFVGTWQTGITRVSDTPTVRYRPAGYTVFDITAAWEVAPGVTLRGAVLNIFDARYFLPSVANSYDRNPSTAAVAATNPIELQTQPGRHFRLGLSVKY